MRNDNLPMTQFNANRSNNNGEKSFVKLNEDVKGRKFIQWNVRCEIGIIKNWKYVEMKNRWIFNSSWEMIITANKFRAYRKEDLSYANETPKSSDFFCIWNCYKHTEAVSPKIRRKSAVQDEPWYCVCASVLPPFVRFIYFLKSSEAIYIWGGDFPETPDVIFGKCNNKNITLSICLVLDKTA